MSIRRFVFIENLAASSSSVGVAVAWDVKQLSDNIFASENFLRKCSKAGALEYH